MAILRPVTGGNLQAVTDGTTATASANLVLNTIVGWRGSLGPVAKGERLAGTSCPNTFRITGGKPATHILYKELDDFVGKAVSKEMI